MIEASGVDFAYDGPPVIADLTTTILRSDKLGIIGPNGSGKTTLLRLLLGQLPPRNGTIRHGTNLEVAYFDQLKATLDEEKTVQQNVSEYDTIVINGQSRHVLGYLRDFLFPPERSRSLVKVLSGGERSRLLLAKLFTKPSNVLVLDEPTNDLDVETLELLETLLVDYQGTVLLVSHDRAFLNDVVTSILAIEADGRVKEYEGGYDDYLRQRPAEAPPSQADRRTHIADEPSTATASPQAEPSRKRSNKERRELETLPGRIEELETELEGLHQAMADPAFYRKAGDEIAEARAKARSRWSRSWPRRTSAGRPWKTSAADRDERIGIAQDDEPLIRQCLRRGPKREESDSLIIEPQSAEPDEDIDWIVRPPEGCFRLRCDQLYSIVFGRNRHRVATTSPPAQAQSLLDRDPMREASASSIPGVHGFQPHANPTMTPQATATTPDVSSRKSRAR